MPLVIVTRDSVSESDDLAAPHEAELYIKDIANPVMLVKEVLGRYTLPHIAGRRASWICIVDSRKIAVWAQEWEGARPLEQEVHLHEGSRVHFDYRVQVDPVSLLE